MLPSLRNSRLNAGFAQTQYKLSGTGGAWLTLSHWVDLQNV